MSETSTLPNSLEKSQNITKENVTRSPFKRRKQLERDLEHITEQMYLRNKELADTNKILALLGTIDTLALEARVNLNTVSQHITEAITQATDYAFVGLLTKSLTSENCLILTGWSGTLLQSKSISLDRPLQIKLSHTWFDKFETSKMLNLDKVSRNEITKLLGIDAEALKRISEQVPIKSLYVFKLLARQQIAGLLVVGYLQSDYLLSESETIMFERLSESIGVALDNKLLFEENTRVANQLKVSNAKLRALDETKDDFISMASHQLRTPLTSIKGYISMLLEGDAGQINDTQKDMLNQSFFSSQRMVYLIADMLNVSRLKTGKFAIENTPVNLADIVEQEMQQLRETAQSHSVEVIYEKPKDFPTLMLDETKIRQVIMNFADNAIYYTPKDGRIEVILKDNPETVELRVKDNGIGVPKSERPHLFTKFYRATNARKARPDGTGLGLFMAKKVILAQGGALIFESEEGKGSTFGFILNKKTHAVTK